MKKFLFSIFSTSILSFAAQAQMVGTDVFHKGNFVEIGTSNYGWYGSGVTPPAGYHPRPTFSLGFVADPAMDGWAAGTPDYMGDYFIPGSPHEGFDVMINGTWNRAWNGWGGFTTGAGPLILTGNNTGYEVIGKKKYGYWNGSMGALQISQTTILDTSRVFFVVDVKLKNTGTTPLTNIYYERCVDPDNEQPLTGDFTTNNMIVFQPSGLSGADNKCLVRGQGLEYPTLSYLGLAAVDCRAKAYLLTSGLSPSVNTQNIYGGSSGYIMNQGGTNTADVGIGIVFNIGTLNPGDSTKLSYAYILRAEDIDSAFSTLEARWDINDGTFQSGDTLMLCRGGEFPITISGGDEYVWDLWYPDVGLATTSGKTNVITVPNDITTYYVVGTNPICLQQDTLTITIKPLGDTTLINHSMCGGSTYNFNGDLVYTTGTYTKIFPTALNACDSVVILSLTVNPLPNVELESPQITICEGESALIRLSNPSANTIYRWYRNNILIGVDTNFQYIANTSGEYYVVGTSAQNCVDTSRKVRITVNPAAVADIQTVADGVMCIGDSLKLAAVTSSNLEYRWSPEKHFRYTTGYRDANVTGIMTDSVNNIVLTVMNQYGCTDTDMLTVYAKPCCDVLMPTVFSPNGDGLNDYFNIMMQPGQVVVSFQIFDRLGNMVYDHHNPKMGWNGNIENGSTQAAQATYMYRVLYSCTDGKNYEKKGDVTLVR